MCMFLFPACMQRDFPWVSSHGAQLRLCCKVLATELYLEPASGTPQSTRRSRSFRTPPRGSGGDTSPRSQAHEGRREGSGSHSDIDLRPERPTISPENTAAVTRWGHTHKLTTREHTHVPSPSPCTCPRTCPQTCFGWPRWREVPEWHCLACGSTLWKWRCHLKQTEAKCYTPTGKRTIVYSGFMVTEHSFHQIGLCSLTPDEEIPQRLSTNSSTYSPAVCWWPLTSGPHSGLMDRPYITTERRAASSSRKKFLVYLSDVSYIRCFRYYSLFTE